MIILPSKYADDLADTRESVPNIARLARYVRGETKPNYPVPAIPIEVLYCTFAIAVCEMNDPVYPYGIITLYPL